MTARLSESQKDTKTIYLCAICNVASGNCSEDCKYCTQSSHYDTGVDIYLRKPIDTIVKEAKIARENKAVSFCLVSASRHINKNILNFICEASKAIKAQVPDLLIIACNGLGKYEDFVKLKLAGVDAYNHNLESSEAYYHQICTTHSWQDRYETNLNAKKAGLMLITGGIFGMGESHFDRSDLLKAIATLNPLCVPLNFYHPNPSLPLKNNIKNKQECFEFIAQAKALMPKSHIMVAGGREYTFKEDQYSIFHYGADAIVIGNYLTTKGEKGHKDIDAIEARGFSIAKNFSEDLKYLEAPNV